MLRILCVGLIAILLPFKMVAADTLSDIKASGKLVFGLEAGYKPFEFLDENNNLVGYDIDV